MLLDFGEFVEHFTSQKKCPSEIAWNGGYILNAELVGKLGLVESYIGTPLGLLVVDGKILCPPLFNKPAFCVDKKGFQKFMLIINSIPEQEVTNKRPEENRYNG